MKKSGSVLLTVIIMTMLASGMSIAWLEYASYNATMSRRSIAYQKARMAAEAGLDHGIRKLKEDLFRYQFSLDSYELDNLLGEINPPAPPDSDFSYQTPDGAYAFEVVADSGVESGDMPEGTHFEGVNGEYQVFTVRCGAYSEKDEVGAVLEQQMIAMSFFIIRFGVFYEEDLEVLPGPEMVFEGPVHCNTDMYIGGPLLFEDNITCHGDIYARRKDRPTKATGTPRAYNDSDYPVPFKEGGITYDSTHEQWMVEALKRWDGRVQSGVHGVDTLDPPINPLDDPYAIIQRPLETTHTNYHEETEVEKYSVKAGLTLHVQADGTLVATDHFGTDVSSRFNEAELRHQSHLSNGMWTYKKKSNHKYKFINQGSYTVDERFYDGRENAWMAPVDIYVDELMDDFPELFSGTTYGVEDGKGLVYVTRDDPTSGERPVVRIRNGIETPSGGLTVATDLPLYLEGNYNTDDTSPCMVCGDAVTLLSEDWQDANSVNSSGNESSLNSRVADSTEYHTVIMTGNTETEAPANWNGSGQYNGGLENVLRFLEKWSGKTVKYRGSIIDLWYAKIANADWSYGSYYKAPLRDWGYDEIFRTQSPPGVTKVYGVQMLTWQDINWDAFD